MELESYQKELEFAIYVKIMVKMGELYVVLYVQEEGEQWNKQYLTYKNQNF